MLRRKTIKAAREAIDYMVVEGRKQRIVITEIYAHRQSSSHRRPDPREEIWRNVVLGQAVKMHRLRVHPELCLPLSNRRNGPGKAIPSDWQVGGVAY